MKSNKIFVKLTCHVFGLYMRRCILVVINNAVNYVGKKLLFFNGVVVVNKGHTQAVLRVKFKQIEIITENKCIFCDAMLCKNVTNLSFKHIIPAKMVHHWNHTLKEPGGAQVRSDFIFKKI